MKDENIQMAFQLAYFIHRDPATARSVVYGAMSKLGAEIDRQIKTIYQPPKGRSSGKDFMMRLFSGKKQAHRTKVHLSEAHLLQRLVYIESDSYERKKEQANNPRPVTEGTLIVHFIKHLARLAFKNNSFYASLCISRFLHNYSTNETMNIYSAVLQNPDRVPQDDYYRRRKAKLLNDLKNRFDRFIRIVRVQHGEERIEAHTNSGQFLELVKQCLNQFKPWKTDFRIPPGFTYQTELRELRFTDQDPDAEHAIEIKRIHALLHYDCYERLAKGLGFDSPAKRLEVPNFVLSEASNSDTNPTAGGDAPGLSQQEIEEIHKQLSKESARRKKAAARIVSLIVDGVRLASFDVRQTDSISIELPEDAELIELHTNDEFGDLLLATHLLNYDWEGHVQTEQLSFNLGGGHSLSLAIEPNAAGESSTLKIACQQGAKPWLPVALPKGFTSHTPVSTGNRAVPLASKSAWAVALLVLGFIGLTLPFFAFWNLSKQSTISSNNRDSGGPQNSATQAPQPTGSSAVTPPPSPPNNAGGDGQAVKSGHSAKEGNLPQPHFPRPGSTPPIDTVRSPEDWMSWKKQPEGIRGGPVPATPGNDVQIAVRPASIKSLLEVKKLIVSVPSDDQSAQELQAALKEALKDAKTFSLTDKDQEADAMLKLELSRRDGKLECKVRCVVAGGITIWPRAPAQQGRDSPAEKPSRIYQGDAQEIARKIAADLRDELKQSEKK